jgi:hypothetical protein
MPGTRPGMTSQINDRRHLMIEAGFETTGATPKEHRHE